MRDQFAAWYTPSPEQREQFILNGLVALDTNILLDLYRMNAEAREDVLALFRHLGQRLWVPHRVALEFHQNRFNVIYEQEEAIQKLETAVRDSRNKIMDAVGKLRNNHPVIDRGKFKEVVESAFAPIHDHFDYIRSEPLISVRTAASNDPVLDAVTDLLAGKVGQPYPAKKMEQVKSDAKRRFEAGQPPGFADKGKDDDRAIGDYVLWRQLLDEACNRKVPVLLITDDQKDDWYRREHGATIGPLAELVEEMLAEAGVPFYALTLARFVQTAPGELRSPVKDTTVSEVNRLEEERRREGLETSLLREALAREWNSRPPASPEASSGTRAAVAHLEVVRDMLAGTIAETEVRLADAVQASGDPASGRDDDPRSYVSTLQARLARDQQRLATVSEQLDQLRQALQAANGST